ncbi:hypothetical protein AUJ46_04210 [Candidatus Peregrinibacteria bacterium CG1_02_54_53]|nr:MAG: hypothetical protein AUJ46_04210 [Candidatus Peregrinibacteria bacterium CG1_02_54_53]
MTGATEGRVPQLLRKEIPMSKKSHPGDGQHGRGVKGEQRPFDEVFAPSQQKPTQEANADAADKK